MGLPFFNGAEKKRDQLISIDLGAQTTKAVHLQRSRGRFAISQFAILDAPVYERSPTAEALGEHLKAICQALDAKTRYLSLAVGVHESIFRHTELPLMPLDDMRQVLKMNTKSYLQQDLPGHVFDCFMMASRATPKNVEKAKVGNGAPKARVLVAGARRQLVDEMQNAAKLSGMVADNIMPGIVGPVNSFELAFPEIFTKEVVALVDIGFKNTTICLLQEGELILSRVVGIGGDRLTQGLAESLGISYVEADGIKIGMASEVQSNLETLVMPLGRELRASIDFFEHQQDKAVGHVFVSGATSRSELIVQMLQTELMLECKSWNPLSAVDLQLPPEKSEQAELAGPQLAVAIGAGIAAL